MFCWLRRLTVVMAGLAPWGLLSCGGFAGLGPDVVLAQAPSPAAEATETPEKARPEAAALVPLNPQKTVLLDKANRRLLLQGEVCLREGVLEMLVCLKRTKEHEAIFSVDTKAQIVHAGLLALGLEPGKPVRFTPEYQAASGPIIEVVASWTDPDGTAREYKGQQLVRNAVRRYWIEKLPQIPADLKLDPDDDLRLDKKRNELLWYGPMSDEQRDRLLKLSKDAAYQKAIRSFHASTALKLLDADWVFSGSSIYVDTETGEKFYQAEAGDLICVANFATATIDLAIPSSAGNDELLYEAYTERLPPVGTKVTIELREKKPPAKADQP